jgi:hypothetical protein
VVSILKRELISRHRWPTRLDLDTEKRTRRPAPQQMLGLYDQQTAAE